MADHRTLKFEAAKTLSRCVAKRWSLVHGTFIKHVYTAGSSLGWREGLATPSVQMNGAATKKDALRPDEQLMQPPARRELGDLLSGRVPDGRETGERQAKGLLPWPLAGLAGAAASKQVGCQVGLPAGLESRDGPHQDRPRDCSTARRRRAAQRRRRAGMGGQRGAGRPGRCKAGP